MFESFSAPGFLVQMPCGPRKSGMPDSVEMPAPVSTTIWSAARRRAAGRSSCSASAIARRYAERGAARPEGTGGAPLAAVASTGASSNRDLGWVSLRGDAADLHPLDVLG